MKIKNDHWNRPPDPTKQAIEVLIFKGGRRLSVNRRLTLNPAFYSVLKKMYEK